MTRRVALLIVILGIPASVRAAAPQGVAVAGLSAASSAARWLAVPDLTRLERATEDIRQLKPLRAVHTVFVADKQFNSAYDRLLRAGLPETEIQLEQEELLLLGLLKKGEDLRRILFQKLNPQVGAFYDERGKVLYVRNRADVLGLRRDLVALAYTHALQDQHFNLRKLEPDQAHVQYRNTDALTARAALVEGDAVNTQNLFVFRTYGRAELQAFVKLQSEPQKAAFPKAIQRSFDFQYTSGLDFAQKLYALGDMSGVDAAYRRLPSSTFEIMHPDKYLAGWKPVSVGLHAVQSLSGWKQADDDVLGAFGYERLLWQYLDLRTAKRVANTYLGDRYILLHNGTQDAMLLKSVWSTSKAAGYARVALTRWLRARYRHVQIISGAGTTVVTPEGASFLLHSGKRLTFTLAPSAGLAQQLAIARTT